MGKRMSKRMGKRMGERMGNVQRGGALSPSG
jgi:hypothetical protein